MSVSQGSTNMWVKVEFNGIAALSKRKFNPQKEANDRLCVELEHIEKETGRLLGTINSAGQLSTKNAFRTGDVLFGKLRPNLRKYIHCDFDGVCSSEIWVLNAQKKTNSHFLFYLIQQEKFIRSACITSGSKMPRADWAVVSEVPFPLPPLPEQKAIADLLSTWDEAIEKTERLIQAKEKRFKWLLRELISEPRNTQKNTEWKKVKLGQVGTPYSGLTGKNKEHFGRGKPYLPYLNVYQNFSVNPRRLDYVQIEEGENQRCIQKGDVFFTVSSETPDEVGISSVLLKDLGECYMNSFCFGWRPNLYELLPEFLQFYFRSTIFRKQMIRLAQGATRFNLSKTELMKAFILFPSPDEQKEIAEALTAAQHEIDLLKQLADKYKTQKRGLMQKMLTGIWRMPSVIIDQFSGINEGDSSNE